MQVVSLHPNEERGRERIILPSDPLLGIQPSVGYFQNSITHKFTWFGNLPTSLSYWFVLIKLTNNINKEEEKIGRAHV